MPKKLWFISRNDEVCNVYDDKEVALDELFYLKEDDDSASFKIYSLLNSDLESYDDEFALAKSEQLI